MQLYLVLFLSALSICPQCQAQPETQTSGDITSLATIIKMMEGLDEKMERLEKQNSRLEQQNERLNQKIEHMEEMMQSESSILIKQEYFSKISNLTREKCDQITQQQCLEMEDFGELFSQLGEEISEMRNITLQQLRVPHCHSKIDNDYMEQQLESVVGSMLKLKSVILPSDCAGHLARGATTSGVYDIVVNGQEFEVFCDMETARGGWLVFQRRQDGFVDFASTWVEYENGFGYPDEEFWLGNKLLHNITSSGQYELRIDLKDKSGSTGFAQYSSFRLGSPQEKYTLNIGTFSGTVKDCLRESSGNNLSGMKFSTKDVDNDKNSGNCEPNRGAWWLNSCANTFLHNIWGNIQWYCWKNQYKSIVFSEMKIRPV